MKNIYTIFICTIISVITLSGCCFEKTIQNNDTKIQINDSEILGDKFIGYLELKSENDILSGLTSSFEIISGFFYPIIISGGSINYSGSVSFTIPTIFKYRDYYHNPQIVNTGDGVIFSSDDQKNLTIETTLVSSGENTESICKRINYGGRISKQEKKIIINGQEIKIAKQRFMTSGEGIKPEKSEQTEICFVRNNISYNIRRSDVNINQNEILNSMLFY